MVVGHITESAVASVGGADTGMGGDKAVAEAEKTALERFTAVLQPYVRDSQALQLTAVYALQVDTKYYISLYQIQIQYLRIHMVQLLPVSFMQG